MGHFRYPRHFMVLLLFAAVLEATVVRAPLGVTARFGLYGALHSIALMVSSRAPLPRAAKFLFVVCATVLSAATAAMTLHGARFMGWAPSMAGPALLLAMGSSLGAVSYAWLVRRFWIPDLPNGAIAAIGVVCMAASLLVQATESMPKTPDGLWIALPWWLAFSAGLGFCERESFKIGGRNRRRI